MKGFVKDIECLAVRNINVCQVPYTGKRSGATHNIINTGSTPLKPHTIYAPADHRDGVVHRSCVQAQADTERFDGRTSD